MSATPGSPQGDDSDREGQEPGTEALQRETDAIRADMDRTLDALERKFSPRQLLDRSLNFMQANGGDVLQKIGATVSKNPLPLLLTSAGLIWLVAASRRSSSSSYGRRRFESSSASTRSGDFDRESESFGSSMEGQAHGLKERAHRTLDATRERASRTWGTTRDRTQELGGTLNGLIREQPLVSGAIALAIGAIVGAAFPATAYERDLVARARTAGGDVLDEFSAEGQGEPATSTTTPTPPTSH